MATEAWIAWTHICGNVRSVKNPTITVVEGVEKALEHSVGALLDRALKQLGISNPIVVAKTLLIWKYYKVMDPMRHRHMKRYQQLSAIALGPIMRLTEHFAVRCRSCPSLAPSGNMVGLHILHRPYLSLVRVMSYRAKGAV